MRIARFQDPSGAVHFGTPDGGSRAMRLAGDLYGGLQPTEDSFPVKKWLSPVEPVNIYCIGLNYRAHAEETGAAIPDTPVIFMKPTTALNHPGADIRLPACCLHGPEVDYEAELAVIIGKTATNVSEAQALNHVLVGRADNNVTLRVSLIGQGKARSCRHSPLYVK